MSQDICRPCGRFVKLASSLLLLFAVSGCAAITNPVANGIPVRILPDELLAETKEDLEPLPLTHLRQKRPAIYKLAAGDILGVYVEGVLGDAEVPPPVNIPEGSDLPPSIGFPLPVRTDGKVPVPLVDPVLVEGLSLSEAEDAITKAYEAKEILRPEDRRILVTLMRPRHSRILVIREDSPGSKTTIRSRGLRGLGTSQAVIGGQQRGSGEVLELPAYENDVLHALARTGGLPGVEAMSEVIIQRGYGDTTAELLGEVEMSALGELVDSGNDEGRTSVRIPLRIRPGQPLPFNPEDIVLNTGDIVIVRGRDPEFYYTGGLMPANEMPLPSNYDLTVVEAVLKSEGPLLNGGVNANNLNGTLVSPGLGNPSPSLLTVLRQTPNQGQVVIRVDLNEAMRDPRENILVQAGDVLLLQETPDEAIARYASEVFGLGIFSKFLDRGSVTGTADVVLP